ncbi:MAG TPA: 2-oxoglutarate dehydrogenase E1 component [Candidatus Eisenbacteria bacterium]|jgi:2-oxoglutarate dehydrogenase E1 component
MPTRLDSIQRANLAYIEEMYERYRRDPAAVPEEWALFFAGFDFAETRAPSAHVPGQPSGEVFALVQHHRAFGHLVADIDPLSDPPQPTPLLDPAQFGFREADLDREVPGVPFKGEHQGTLRELIAALRATYCGPIGVEYMAITDSERREWLQERMEPVRNRPALPPEERARVLRQMLAADRLEEFLHVRYPGQKRFSLEGAASLIPMLDALVETAAATGVEQVVIGMPHRGRLNVLAHILEKPLERIFSEFESTFLPEDVQGHGDVKYHMGYSSNRVTRAGRTVHLDLNFNPSHLEFVNPVVLGAMRARQDYMGDGEGARGVPVLIHGDASFAGEGIVPETLAMAQLANYRTGGTIHIIVNNQIGFTTSPEDGRASRYVTDVARVEDAPVFHVNGDDPEAAVHAIRVAVAYRDRWKGDVFVDLVCYRRHGHNELDDPTFTQPVMYQKIAAHRPAALRYGEQLTRERALEPAGLREMEREIEATLREAHARARSEPATNDEARLGGAWTGFEWAGQDWSARTAVPRATLDRVLREAARLPADFHPHPKVAKLLDDRIRMAEEDRIDWGSGEVLAIGTLLLDGFGVRLSGQDTARGTFSHRHAVLHDHENGRRHVPLQHLTGAHGRFQVFDTLLSEAAVLGFEYGYSTADPHALVIWEAQFGDFGNVAQVYIDQFLASAESKWRRMSGITLLLPHGYEGQGPEHSSARLERFLELCADGNMQVCNLTTPAQLFHALRRQMHRRFRKPLVIMSPKSLLRHKLAVSAVRDFTSDAFRTVIDDLSLPDPRAIRSVLLSSGRIGYALQEARAQRSRSDVALVRVEQLYPFPADELREVFKRYPEARDLRWVQEEPANMGAWRSTRHRLEAILPEGATLTRVARKAAPTPATGYYQMHVDQEKALLERAFRELPLHPHAARRDTPAGARAGGKA